MLYWLILLLSNRYIFCIPNALEFRRSQRVHAILYLACHKKRLIWKNPE